MRHGLSLFCFVHDRVDVDATRTTLGSVGDGIDLEIEGIQRTQDEAKFGPRMATFDLDDPLAADAEALGKSCLIQFELFAPVANEGAEIRSSPHEHGRVLP
jgi:hypothetical protein